MNSYGYLINGYKAFRDKYLGEEYDAYRGWAGQAQHPRVMIIACSDSRVSPVILTYAGLGEIFSANNVANIVPPFDQGQHAHHSIGAAVQYGVTVLEVEHIIIMGHSGCGGIRALMSQTDEDLKDIPKDDYISGWVNVIADAREAVKRGMADEPFEHQCEVCEMEGVLVSLGNLMTYPYVKAAVDKGKLDLHGWYFHIQSGELLEYKHKEGQYRRMVR